MASLFDDARSVVPDLKAIPGRQAYHLDVPGTESSAEVSVVSYTAKEKMGTANELAIVFTHPRRLSRDGYRGINERYRFTCTRGHQWETRGQPILDGSGCRQCIAQSYSQRYLHADGLERLHVAAAARGGKCLATLYDGISAGYTWECGQGHKWNAEGAKVVAGSWCGTCAAQRRIAASRLTDGLERLRAAAVARGGVCLDEAYGKLEDKYRFRCAKGHEWKAHGHLVLGGTWCRECSNESKRLGIERMREVAQARGGRCLSEIYLGNRVKLGWQCHLGHVWNALPLNVTRGAWCPFCFRLRITKDSARRVKYGG